MLGDLKRRLIVTRAQGAYAVADLAMDQGDPSRALGLYREQARDLAGRGADKELEVRGWYGVVRSATALLRRGELASDALRESLGALSGLERGHVPPAWLQYDGYRELATLLLEQAPPRAVELAGLLTRLFPVDPRPHYLLARALEAELGAIWMDEGRRASWAERALDAYRQALLDAVEVGAVRRWEATVNLRMAALLWRHRRPVDPDAGRFALELVDKLDRAAIQQAAPAYRLVVAQLWLGTDRAMSRLRALDMLEELVDEPTIRDAALRVVDAYLEQLGWSYYPTEHDRVRSIFVRVAPSLGPDEAHRGRAYLDLLGRLHDSEGRRAPPSRSHLQTLHAIEVGRGHTVSAAYYAVALRLVDAAPEDFDAALAAALDDHAEAVRQVWTRLLVEPLAIALGALNQWRRFDRAEVRQLLRAFGHAPWAVPHVQESFGLLAPPLILHLPEAAELSEAAIEALERYVRLAPRPRYGFASVGAAMLGLGECEVAAQAARRAMAERAHEPGETLDALVYGLARRALRRGEVREAAGWLVGLRPAPSATGAR